MKQQLKEAQEDLDDTKRDHAYDMQSQGFDKLSEDLKTSLDDTEYEISHNADKQLEIINSMLDKAVSSYQEAYGKINSIIKNTGWVGSTDFNNTQSDLSTETGVKNQNSNASQSQSNANKKPSKITNCIICRIIGSGKCQPFWKMRRSEPFGNFSTLRLCDNRITLV